MKVFYFLVLTIFLASCGGTKNDTDGTEASETAQQVGDVMASVDEVGGVNGNISYLENSIKQTFARYAPQELKETFVTKVFLPQAQAVSCNGYGFAGCQGTSITRTFAGCTIGAAVFTGSVITTWSGTGVTTCGLSAINNKITRSPSFTVAGRRGATLTVSKSGSVGQEMTWAAGSSPKVFNYTNDGINRKFTSGVGIVIMNFTTKVISPITVTGTLRGGRIMDGGSLEVKNNITNMICTYAPVNVLWPIGSTCNCPTQGTWQGNCTDGISTKSTTLVLNGCGTGTYTEGTQTDPVIFDRCGI